MKARKNENRLKKRPKTRTTTAMGTYSMVTLQKVTPLMVATEVVAKMRLKTVPTGKPRNAECRLPKRSKVRIEIVTARAQVGVKGLTSEQADKKVKAKVMSW